MNKQRRHEMLKTQSLIQKEWKRHFAPIIVQKEKTWKQYELIERKIYNEKSPPFRAYFISLCARYLSTDLDTRMNVRLFYQQLPLLAETIICIQYYYNYIYDDKGINSIITNLSLGNKLREYLFEYIEKEIEDDYQKAIRRTVREILSYVEIGQAVEQSELKYQKFKQQSYEPSPFGNEIEKYIDQDVIEKVVAIIPQTYKNSHIDFLQLYFKRIYLTCTTLFIKFVELLADLMQVSSEYKSSLLSYTKYLGIMRQLVNDNCDFVPTHLQKGTVAKVANDAFADIRNRNITLPLFLYLNSKPDNDLEQLLDGNCLFREKDTQIQVFENLREAIRASIEIGKQISHLSLLNLDNTNVTFKEFEDINQYAFYNRFYFELYERYR